jgi:hypothetical protein
VLGSSNVSASAKQKVLNVSRISRSSPIRVSRAWSTCRAPGLGLEQQLVPLTEPEPVGSLRSEPVLVVPRLEWALARAMTSWTELFEVP